MTNKFNFSVYLLCCLAFGLFFVFAGFGFFSILAALAITMFVFFFI